MSDSNTSCDLTDYACADKGLLLPLVSEYTWYKEARIVLYFVGLLWSFLGVAIIADIFMRAIEMITSRRHKIKVADLNSDTGFTEVEVMTWNGTVANLSLMALGSSAPEILLSVIEIVGNGFKSGTLGPSTIVGSAAFNFMVIVGVCMMAIPNSDKRIIKHLKVFAVTTIFSVFAYLWLIIILVVITPDYVDLWEGFLTLIFFPILILTAYIADKNYFGKPHDQEDEVMLALGGEAQNPDEKKKEMIAEIIKTASAHPDMTEEDAAKIAAVHISSQEPHSRGWYRRHAINAMTGGNKMKPLLSERQQELLDSYLTGEPTVADVPFRQIPSKQAIIEFAAPAVSVLERDARVHVTIMRHGNVNCRAIFKIDTIDGTAEANSDYIPIKQTLIFEPKETTKHIPIEIIDDNEWELDEVFFVRISVEPKQPASVGKRNICQVTIVNDDEPGEIAFKQPSLVVKESVGTAIIPVERLNGCDGTVSVLWETVDTGSARSGMDFMGGSGELVFEHGEISKNIEIRIKDDKNKEKDEHFELKLLEATKGAKLGKTRRSIITIVNDDDYDGIVSRVVDLTSMNLDSLKVETYTWGQQFKEAMNVNGGDVENARPFDYVMHFAGFFWKIIFAFIPPPSIWGGWLAFFVSLMLIGLLTAIVGDLASIFGCLIDLKDSVTAITFVALGTSLPDLFASKQAAVGEKYADSSVGNVTGSNSVNVFLGLGLPWFFAACYWQLQGKTFEVPAGSLGFSVTVYTVLSLVGIGVIILRRLLKPFGNAELGGARPLDKATGFFMIFLWILYVLIVSMQVYGHIPSF